VDRRRGVIAGAGDGVFMAGGQRSLRPAPLLPSDVQLSSQLS
jgi:hypothetical protein